MSSKMFPAECPVCHMAFKGAMDLGTHIHSIHSNEEIEAALGVKGQEPQPEGMRYVQTCFTPEELEVMDCLVALGLCSFRHKAIGANPISILAEVQAIQQLAKTKPEVQKSMLYKLSNLTHGQISREDWDAKTDVYKTIFGKKS